MIIWNVIGYRAKSCVVFSNQHFPFRCRFWENWTIVRVWRCSLINIAADKYAFWRFGYGNTYCTASILGHLCILLCLLLVCDEGKSCRRAYGKTSHFFDRRWESCLTRPIITFNSIQTSILWFWQLCHMWRDYTEAGISCASSVVVVEQSRTIISRACACITCIFDTPKITRSTSSENRQRDGGRFMNLSCGEGESSHFACQIQQQMGWYNIFGVCVCGARRKHQFLWYEIQCLSRGKTLHRNAFG